MNDAATIAFWLAVVLAVSGSVAVLWRAWVQWRAAVRSVRAAAIEEAWKALEPPKSSPPPPRPWPPQREVDVAGRLRPPPLRPSSNAFEVICDDAMETETRRAADRAQARRPKSFGPYQG